MVRNHGLATGIALTAAGLAVVAGVIAGLLRSRSRAQWYFLATGLFLFLVSAGFAIYAGVKTWGDQGAPVITASVDGKPGSTVVDLGVKSTGLKAGERVRVAIWPLLSESGAQSIGFLDSGYSYSAGGLPLYQSISGPSSAGEVEFQVKAPLSPDRPSRVVVQAAVGSKSDSDLKPGDCFAAESDSGCVILDLGSNGRPQLEASFEGTDKSQSLVLKVSGERMPQALTRLRVVGRGGGKARPLARAALSANAVGAIDQTLEVPIPQSVRSVCIVASLAGRFTCPPSKEIPPAELAWCINAKRSQVPLEGNDRRLSRAQAARSCRAGYPAYIASTTTWARVRAP